MKKALVLVGIVAIFFTASPVYSKVQEPYVKFNCSEWKVITYCPKDNICFSEPELWKLRVDFAYSKDGKRYYSFANVVDHYSVFDLDLIYWELNIPDAIRKADYGSVNMESWLIRSPDISIITFGKQTCNCTFQYLPFVWDNDAYPAIIQDE